MKPKSFVNERSVEYILASNLADELSAEYGTVVPIFFWKTREGSKAAAEGMIGRGVRLLTVFARRPKIFHPDDLAVIMKVNRMLFRAADASYEVGSPVFVGIPLASSLLQLTMQAHCLWFRLPLTNGVVGDMEFTIPVDGSLATGSVPPLEGPLDTLEIFEAARAGRAMLWHDVVVAMGNIRDSSSNSGHWLLGGGGCYRPFFILLGTDD